MTRSVLCAVAAITTLAASCREAPAPAPVDDQTVVAHDRSDLGAIEVQGDTSDWYAISRDGESVGGNPPMLNTARELEPGEYEVAVNETVRTVKVEAGKKTVLRTGSLVVEGTGGSWWFPQQGTETKVAANPPTLGKALALFPGTYTVSVKVGTQVEKLSGASEVVAGRRTVVSR